MLTSLNVLDSVSYSSQNTHLNSFLICSHVFRNAINAKTTIGSYLIYTEEASTQWPRGQHL